jgi:Fe-S-cluster containining protein
MGEIIEIREDLGSDSFRIGFSVTGEERIISIDPEKRDQYRKEEIRTVRPVACPFLRQDIFKKSICSVHASRPDLCRRYSCHRILVLDTHDTRIGTVIDSSRYLITLDADLRRIWNREVGGADIMDENCWEQHVEQVLTCHGYRVMR